MLIGYDSRFGMARPKLKKIDPSLDLSRHLIGEEALPRPWDPSKIFGRAAPLEIEVGPGKGLFLRNAAAAHPEIDYLGIEVARRYAQFAAFQLAQRGLTNAVIVWGDAVRVFHHVLPDGVASAIHIYFPDPWWKKRHKKRRVIRESFVQRIEAVLKAPGTLHLWTDVEEYFDTACQLLAAYTRLDGPYEVPETPAQHDLDYRTHFERRTRLQGKPVYRGQWYKR